METTLRIDSLTYGEAGIGRTDEGKAVFVPQTAPGDVVRVRIDQDKKSFSTGTVIDVLEESPHRVSPACPYSAICGGCSWMHVAYETQLEAKRANVVSQLVHIGGFDKQTADELVSPCTASTRQLGYRNKLELSAGLDDRGHWQLGFRSEGSHQFATPDVCLLAHKAIQKAPKALRGALRYLQRGEDLGIYRVGVRHSERTRDVEIALWTPPSPFPRAMAANTLQSTLKASSIVRVIADPGKARKVKTQQGTVLLPGLAETPGCRCPVLTPPLSPAGARWEPGQRQAEPHRHRGPDGWHGEARGPPGRLSRPMAAAGAVKLQANCNSALQQSDCLQ